MSRKLVTGCTLVMMICFLLLGVIFKNAADNHQGVSVSMGVMIDGQYSENTSGRIGANSEKYEMFNKGGTAFYILAGVTGVMCVISAMGRKKTNDE